MVSDFRKKKFTYLFKVFFDCDSCGSITVENLKSMIAKISKAKGWVAGDEAYKQAESVMLEIWEAMQSVADQNKDGQISLDEWISMWDTAFKNPSDRDSFQAHYRKAIFFLLDSSADSAIDKDEFVNVYSSFGASKEDAAQAFDKAVDGKTSINGEDFQKRWDEYFNSEDESAPGNYIFGNLNF